MKFIGVALIINASVSNAQSVDFVKERKENPVGGDALACVSIGNALNVDLGKQHPKYGLIRGMLHTATKTVFSAYNSPEVFNDKIMPAVMQGLSDLQRDKVKNDAAYQRKKSEYFTALDACVKSYPDPLGLNAK